MSTFTNVDGVYRQTFNHYVNINGVWRATSPRVCTEEGVWRETGPLLYREPDVLGFQVVYTLNKSKSYEKLPHLKYNQYLPVNFHLTGVNNDFNTDDKGVIFEYVNTREPLIEGIVCYDATVFMLLNDDLVVDICSTPDMIGSDSHISTDVHDDILINARAANMDVKILSKASADTNGFNTEGWNRMCTTEDILGKLSQEDPDDYTYNQNMNAIILPYGQRDPKYYPGFAIGIARDMHTAGLNMVGSWGYLSQTIMRITVDDIEKPFIITIVD